MIMYLANGGCVTDNEFAYISKAKIFYPNERIEYKLNDAVISDGFRNCANTQYLSEHNQNLDAKNLVKFLVIENGNTFIEVRNKDDGTFIRRKAKLSEAEERYLSEKFI